MKYNLGEINELKFVKYLHLKKVCDLNPMFLNFITNIFDNIKETDLIQCYKNIYPTKTDIFVKINKQQKRISIKMGYNNSVHIEPISSFIHFLIENNIDKDIVMKYLKFHYADGTTNGTGIKRLSASEYKKIHQDEIDCINKIFNDNDLIKKAINRFILQGRNSKYEVDVIIHGTPEDFLWIKKDDIYKIMLNNNYYSTGVHFGKLFCQPQDRCINHNHLYEKKRFCVQIKWYSLFDDIIENMNNNICSLMDN